jgi:hypothetical protein
MFKVVSQLGACVFFLTVSPSLKYGENRFCYPIDEIVKGNDNVSVVVSISLCLSLSLSNRFCYPIDEIVKGNDHVSTVVSLSLSLSVSLCLSLSLPLSLFLSLFLSLCVSLSLSQVRREPLLTSSTRLSRATTM